jgi:hypothetical protein
MIIVKPTQETETSFIPSEQFSIQIGKFNDALARASAGRVDGARPRLKRTRVRFAKLKRTLMDGPFAETKELIGGF